MGYIAACFGSYGEGMNWMKTEMPQDASSSRRRLAMSFFGALAILLALGTLFLKGVGESRRLAAVQTASDRAQKIGLRLHESLGAAYLLAGLVQQGKGEVRDFAEKASSIMAIFPHTASLQLAPNGVIRQVYPESGNENVIGSDLLRSSLRRIETHQAMASRQMVLGGPYPVIQGGVAVIGRLPVFLRNADGWDEFWGLAIVLIPLQVLLESARVADLVEDGYRFEVCRLDEDGACNVFSRHGSESLGVPVAVGIEVPHGRWLLRLEPKDGWVPYVEQLLIVAGSLILAVLFAATRYSVQRGSNLGPDGSQPL
jgi:sensor domain CHASE-containing protein